MTTMKQSNLSASIRLFTITYPFCFNNIEKSLDWGIFIVSSAATSLIRTLNILKQAMRFLGYNTPFAMFKSLTVTSPDYHR